MKSTWLRRLCNCLCAALMALAPFMDLAAARKARPDVADLFGYVYQAIARTFASVAEQPLTIAILFFACLWLCRRYLWHKPAHTGIGEYALCLFWAGMTLLATAVHTQDTVSVLWANAFQFLKACMCLGGLYSLYLTLLRGLRELLAGDFHVSLPTRLRRFAAAHPLGAPFAVLCAAWLPHIIIRYPGVLMWDTYWNILQYIGASYRVSTHPPFCTLLFGSLYSLGLSIGDRNIVYFLFTLLQCTAFIAVLSYSLSVMRRLRVPAWLRLCALCLYALSPCYVGWATVMAKDSLFLLFFLLMAALLMELAHSPDAFFAQWKRCVWLGIAFLMLMLTRHNGAPLVAAVCAGVLVLVLVRKGAWRRLMRFAVCAVSAFVLFWGANAAIKAAMDIHDIYMPDVLSLPFQQTARVVKLHGDDIPAEEREIIDRVLDYDVLAQNYDEWYADGVKDTYRQTATAADRSAYFAVWWQQLLRWPTDHLDAALHMNGVLFDPQYDRPMYISLSDMELYPDVFPYSYNDMNLYEREALVPLNSAQRALAQWYMDFDSVPVVGLFASMSFASALTIWMLYLCWTTRRRAALLVWLPSAVMLVTCLFVPVVYLRYALTVVCALPINMAAYVAIPSAKTRV